MKIDGKQIASDIYENLKKEVQKLSEQKIYPILAIILMGDDQASQIYVRQKELKAKEVGIQAQIFRFDKNIDNNQIETLVKKLDSDPKIHGVILQRPAPPHIKIDRLEEFISAKKEVDGFGKNPAYPVPVAEAVFKMVKDAFNQSKLSISFDNWLKNQKIVVLGKGETAGRPIADYFEKLRNKPTIVDSKTENRDETIKSADIVITAVGRPNIVNASILKKGVILVGVGIYRDSDGKLKGDYDEEDVAKVAGFYSPTPGGVGPVNVACLLENVVKAVSR